MTCRRDSATEIRGPILAHGVNGEHLEDVVEQRGLLDDIYRNQRQTQVERATPPTLTIHQHISTSLFGVLVADQWHENPDLLNRWSEKV